MKYKKHGRPFAPSGFSSSSIFRKKNVLRRIVVFCSCCTFLQALPDDETVFFERTPLSELEVTHLAAFGETGPRREDTIEQMVNSGLIVRVSGRERPCC